MRQSLSKLEELVLYVNSLWPQTNTNPNASSSLTSSLFLKAKTSQRQSQSSMINMNINEQIAKLRKVNSFLQSIDTNLQQIIEGISQIYIKVKDYADAGDTNQTSKHFYMDNGSENRMKRQEQNEEVDYNTQVVENIFTFINEYLFKEPLRDTLAQKNPKQLAIWLLQIETKLSVLPFFMDSACKFKSDITTCQPFVKQYSHAWSNIRVIEMDHIKDTIGSQLLRLKRMMKIVTSSVVNQMSTLKVELVKKLIFGLSFPYYWLADEESQLKCYKIWRKPKVQNLNQVWNIPEMGAIKQCKKIVFPSIKTSLFIYIPASQRPNVNQEQYKPEIFSESPDYACVRTSVLYYKRLKFAEDYSKFQPCTCFPCIDVAEEQDLETILIHLHGGGFVALSSQTMQSYTRKWANQLKIPIFSIDYRKPPAHRFPVALEDSLAAYEFIIENIHKYFKIRPTNVILAGDSAGGNLAVSLYASLLMKNYPVLPKGIFLAYPAVDLRMRFSPSRMNSFDDPILLPPLLLLCLKEYLGQNSLNEYHPLASPILLTQEFIKSGKYGQVTEGGNKWPRRWAKTRIMVGKKDPLFDDSLRLVERMTYAGVDAKLTVYSQFSHAFLSLDAVIESCLTAINDSIEEIRGLM